MNSVSRDGEPERRGCASGVSVATASRVANGSTRASAGTGELVEWAMRDALTSSPGGAARLLIGLLVPELQNPVFPRLAEAMDGPGDTVRQPRLDPHHGRLTPTEPTTSTCAARPARGRDDLHLLRGHRSAPDRRYYRRLLDEGAKLVFVNGGAPAPTPTSVGEMSARGGSRWASTPACSATRSSALPLPGVHALDAEEVGRLRSAPARSRARAGGRARRSTRLTAAGGREAAHRLRRPIPARREDLAERPRRGSAFSRRRSRSASCSEESSIVGFDGRGCGDAAAPDDRGADRRRSRRRRSTPSAA